VTVTFIHGHAGRLEMAAWSASASWQAQTPTLASRPGTRQIEVMKSACAGSRIRGRHRCDGLSGDVVEVLADQERGDVGDLFGRGETA
jgi:hypothetical protein